MRPVPRHHARRHTRALILTAGLVALGCGGDAGNGGATPDPAPPEVEAPPEPAQTEAPDPQLAAEGEQLFTARACSACHTVGGGRLVGPDLEGVTTRRARTWILSMITNPDSMIREDSIARRLYGEYMTPMANQNLTAEQAVALFEFLRQHDEAN